MFLRSFTFTDTADLEYLTDNGIEKKVQAAVVQVNFGNGSRNDKTKPDVSLFAYECSISMERDLAKRHLKNLSIGIEATRGMSMWPSREAGVAYSSPSISQLYVSRDVFLDRNISIGLRLAVGLWK